LLFCALFIRTQIYFSLEFARKPFLAEFRTEDACTYVKSISHKTIDCVCVDSERAQTQLIECFCNKLSAVFTSVKF